MLWFKIVMLLYSKGCEVTSGHQRSQPAIVQWRRKTLTKKTKQKKKDVDHWRTRWASGIANRIAIARRGLQMQQYHRGSTPPIHKKKPFPAAWCSTRTCLLNVTRLMLTWCLWPPANRNVNVFWITLTHTHKHTHTSAPCGTLHSRPEKSVGGVVYFYFAPDDDPFEDIVGTQPSSWIQVLLVRCHCGCRWPVYVFSSKLDLPVTLFWWHDDTSHNHWIAIKYWKEIFLKGVGLPTAFCKRLLHVFLQFFNPRPHHASFESLQLQTSFSFTSTDAVGYRDYAEGFFWFPVLWEIMVSEH